MNRIDSHSALGALVILLAMLACMLPGQSVAPEPNPSPVNLETAVAGTAQAAEQQTARALPATPTGTVAPTVGPTLTPKISLIGTSLLVREDQSTVFTDHKVGFQLVFPAGWLAVRINEKEYFDAFALDVVLNNAPINDRLAKIQSNNADYFRLDAIDVRPGHIFNGMITDVTVILQPESATTTLEQWAKHAKTDPSPFEGHKFLSSKYQQTANGTRILVTEENWMFDQEDKVFFRRVYFMTPSGVVTLDFETLLDSKDVVLPDFEQIVNSLTFLSP